MSPADDADLDPAFAPDPVRHITDAQTLRAISDPTRMRMVETMVQRQDPAWSVKELAAALGVPQTRLYHHVEQLLVHDIIRAVERRVVSGIIETRYRVAALSFQLDRRLFEGDTDDARTILHQTLGAVFDTARDEIEAAMRSGAIDPRGEDEDGQVLVSRNLVRLSPARAAELRARLQDLAREFDDDPPDAAPDALPWGVVLAVYPMTPSKEP